MATAKVAPADETARIAEIVQGLNAAAKAVGRSNPALETGLARMAAGVAEEARCSKLAEGLRNPSLKESLFRFSESVSEMARHAKIAEGLNAASAAACASNPALAAGLARMAASFSVKDRRAKIRESLLAAAADAETSNDSAIARRLCLNAAAAAVSASDPELAAELTRMAMEDASADASASEPARAADAQDVERVAASASDPAPAAFAEESRRAEIVEGLNTASAAVGTSEPALSAGLARAATGVAEESRRTKMVEGLASASAAVSESHPALAAGLARMAAGATGAVEEPPALASADAEDDDEEEEEVQQAKLDGAAEATEHGIPAPASRSHTNVAEEELSHSRPEAASREASPEEEERERSAPPSSQAPPSRFSIDSNVFWSAEDQPQPRERYVTRLSTYDNFEDELDLARPADEGEAPDGFSKPAVQAADVEVANAKVAALFSSQWSLRLSSGDLGAAYRRGSVEAGYGEAETDFGGDGHGGDELDGAGADRLGDGQGGDELDIAGPDQVGDGDGDGDGSETSEEVPGDFSAFDGSPLGPRRGSRSRSRSSSRRSAGAPAAADYGRCLTFPAGEGQHPLGAAAADGQHAFGACRSLGAPAVASASPRRRSRSGSVASSAGTPNFEGRSASPKRRFSGQGSPDSTSGSFGGEEARLLWMHSPEGSEASEEWHNASWHDWIEQCGCFEGGCAQEFAKWASENDKWVLLCNAFEDRTDFVKKHPVLGSPAVRRTLGRREFLTLCSGIGFSGDADAVFSEIQNVCNDHEMMRQKVQHPLDTDMISLRQLKGFQQKAMAMYGAMSKTQPGGLLHGFLELMLRSRGSVLRAFRLDMDVRGFGRVPFFDFARYCRELHCKTNTLMLWRCFRPNSTGGGDPGEPLRFQELGGAEVANLDGFIDVLWQAVSFDLDAAWGLLRASHPTMVTLEEFVNGCYEMGFEGDASVIFHGLRSDKRTRLSREDFSYLAKVARGAGRQLGRTARELVSWAQRTVGGPLDLLTALRLRAEDTPKVSVSELAARLTACGYPGNAKQVGLEAARIRSENGSTLSGRSLLLLCSGQQPQPKSRSKRRRSAKGHVWDNNRGDSSRSRSPTPSPRGSGTATPRGSFVASPQRPTRLNARAGTAGRAAERARNRPAWNDSVDGLSSVINRELPATQRVYFSGERWRSLAEVEVEAKSKVPRHMMCHLLSNGSQQEPEKEKMSDKPVRDEIRRRVEEKLASAPPVDRRPPTMTNASRTPPPPRRRPQRGLVTRSTSCTMMAGLAQLRASHNPGRLMRRR
eukprot:TRINITY_DN19914_c0_g3_i1.p1 TRINITY_DN19914_c0_g3~~TRINITY_DN19914_c0_g3_i1.p1  ORF type:complete len:1437 (+),score=363.73 TRINITY_DN19914_c0_g3_i1:481-4311(+)